jgi:hypothetical protein
MAIASASKARSSTATVFTVPIARNEPPLSTVWTVSSGKPEGVVAQRPALDRSWAVAV